MKRTFRYLIACALLGVASAGGLRAAPANVTAIEQCLGRIQGHLAALADAAEQDQAFADAMMAADAAERRPALGAYSQHLRQRIAREELLLDELAKARGLFAEAGAGIDAERQRLLKTQELLQRRLALTDRQLQEEVRKVSRALGDPERLPVYEGFAQDKALVLEELAKQIQSADPRSGVGEYLDAWESATRARLLVDRYHLLNVAYCADALSWAEERNQALAAAGVLEDPAVLSQLGEASFGAANLSAVLDHQFGRWLTADKGLWPAEQAAALPATNDPLRKPVDGFTAAIMPGRGVGGVYYYASTPEGLHDPVKQTDARGQVYYAERIPLRLAASEDCSFVLNQTDAAGKRRNLNPDRDHPHLSGGKSLTVLGVAGARPGLLVFRLVVTPRGRRGPSTAEVALARALGQVADRPLQMRTVQRSVERGDRSYVIRADRDSVTVQRRHTLPHLAAPDTAWYRPNAAGAAAVAESYVIILPRPNPEN